MDLAGGDGSGAIWLADRGHTAALVEVSDVAIDLATARAAGAGADLITAQVDLEGQTVGSILQLVGQRCQTDDPPALVTCLHYLNRALLASVAAGLAPGTTFLASIATVNNLERHERPSARFLLEPGELHALVFEMSQSDQPNGLTLIHHFEGWNADGTHEAEIIVRRPRHLSDWAERPMHKDRSQQWPADGNV